MMALPTSTEMKKVILELLKDKKTHTIKETKEYVIQKLKISDTDRNKYDEKRKKRNFDLQIVNALSALRKDGTMENVEKGIFKLTSKGNFSSQSNTNSKSNK